MSNKAHLCLIFSLLLSFSYSCLALENDRLLLQDKKMSTSFMSDNLNLIETYVPESVSKPVITSIPTIPQNHHENISSHIGLRIFSRDRGVSDLPTPLAPKDLAASSSENIDIWTRIRQGFKISNQPSPLVFERINWYLKRKSYLEALLLRAKPYLHFILGELEKRKMPTELALLPFVESGFNPFATSHAKATGLWQFIPSTGHSYQLKQDWWVDQRRDIVASTEAALDYLNTLHAKFSSWRLALIAYNWGDGKLQKAIQYNIKHHQSTSPEHLIMPRETRYYIPSLEAIKYIVNSPEKYGVNLPSISNHPYLFATEVDIHLDVVTASRLAELPLKEFLYFNPSFKSPLINKESSQSPSIILLPVQKADIFRRNLLVYKKSGTHLLNWTIEHYPHPTPAQQISKKFHIPIRQLLLSNGKNLKTQWIQGDILIPMNAQAWAEWTKQANSLHLHSMTYTHHTRHHRRHYKKITRHTKHHIGHAQHFIKHSRHGKKNLPH